MNKNNQKFLKEVFYKYWMLRVPELDEYEAIDHLEWEIGIGCNLGYKANQKLLQDFLKEKKVKFKVK